MCLAIPHVLALSGGQRDQQDVKQGSRNTDQQDVKQGSRNTDQQDVKQGSRNTDQDYGSPQVRHDHLVTCGDSCSVIRDLCFTTSPKGKAMIDVPSPSSRSL